MSLQIDKAALAAGCYGHFSVEWLYEDTSKVAGGLEKYPADLKGPRRQLRAPGRCGVDDQLYTIRASFYIVPARPSSSINVGVSDGVAVTHHRKGPSTFTDLYLLEKTRGMIHTRYWMFELESHRSQSLVSPNSKVSTTLTSLTPHRGS